MRPGLIGKGPQARKLPLPTCYSFETRVRTINTAQVTVSCKSSKKKIKDHSIYGHPIRFEASVSLHQAKPFCTSSHRVAPQQSSPFKSILHSTQETSGRRSTEQHALRRRLPWPERIPTFDLDGQAQPALAHSALSCPIFVVSSCCRGDIQLFISHNWYVAAFFHEDSRSRSSRVALHVCGSFSCRVAIAPITHQPHHTCHRRPAARLNLSSCAPSSCVSLLSHHQTTTLCAFRMTLNTVC